MKGIFVLVIAALAATVMAEDKCPSNQAENWDIEKLLVHEDCDKFYKCTYGEPVEQLCPPLLYFNIGLLQCDWIDNVDCGDRNVPGGEKQTEEEVDPEPKPEPETESESEQESEAKPEPESESAQEPETKPEPESESEQESEPKPDSESESAQEPETKPESEPESESAQEPEPKPEPESESAQEPDTDSEPETDPEEEVFENGCPVDPHVHRLLPHEDDCNLFYYCVSGGKVLRQCPSTLHFNRNLQVCDWPHDAECVSGSQRGLNKHLLGRRTIKL